MDGEVVLGLVLGFKINRADEELFYQRVACGYTALYERE